MFTRTAVSGTRFCRTVSSSNYANLKCEPLSKEVDGALTELPGWQLHDGNKIIRRFDVSNFVFGVEFINKLATMAEEEGHHPDVHLTEYKNLAIVYWSHDVGGLSKNDLICASKVNQLWKQHTKE